MRRFVKSPLKTRPSRREDPVQQAIVSLARLLIPPEIGLVFAIPNGGKRNPIEAAIMKSMGVTPGMPDLGIALRGARIVWMEVKAPPDPITGAKGGSLSPEQKDIHALLRALGHEVYVVDDVAEAGVVLKRLAAESRAYAATEVPATDRPPTVSKNRPVVGSKRRLMSPIAE